MESVYDVLTYHKLPHFVRILIWAGLITVCMSVQELQQIRDSALHNMSG